MTSALDQMWRFHHREKVPSPQLILGWYINLDTTHERERERVEAWDQSDPPTEKKGVDPIGNLLTVSTQKISVALLRLALRHNRVQRPSKTPTLAVGRARAAFTHKQTQRKGTDPKLNEFCVLSIYAAVTASTVWEKIEREKRQIELTLYMLIKERRGEPYAVMETKQAERD